MSDPSQCPDTPRSLCSFENELDPDSGWIAYRTRVEEWSAIRRLRTVDLIVRGETAVELACAHMVALAGYKVVILSQGEHASSEPRWQYFRSWGKASRWEDLFIICPHLVFAKTQANGFVRAKPIQNIFQKFLNRLPPCVLHAKRYAREHLVAARSEGAYALSQVEVKRITEVLGQGVEIDIVDGSAPANTESSHLKLKSKYLLSFTPGGNTGEVSCTLEDPFGSRTVSALGVGRQSHQYGVTVVAPKVMVSGGGATIAHRIARDVARAIIAADDEVRNDVILPTLRSLPGAYHLSENELLAMSNGIPVELIREFGGTASKFSGTRILCEEASYPQSCLTYLARVEQVCSLKKAFQ